MLPPGDHAPDERRFREAFVEVSGSRTRRPIYEGWCRLRSGLLAQGLAADDCALVDGSYTTSKTDPEDLDVVVGFRTDSIDFANRVAATLLRGPGSKRAYRCDAYPLPILPAAHPDHQALTVGPIAYWRKWFGTDRSGRPKGRVWMRIAGR